MWHSRSPVRAAWCFALGLGYCITLSGCGSSDSDTGPPVMTDAQKSAKAAQEKETADAFKDFQKTKKKR